jgi:hypothetical protein
MKKCSIEGCGKEESRWNIMTNVNGKLLCNVCSRIYFTPKEVIERVLKLKEAT